MIDDDFELDLALQVHADPALPEELVLLLASRTLAAVGLARGTVELGVWFVAPSRMRELNSEHREVDAATDVLSFPIDEAEELAPGMPRQLGDVLICGPYVEDQVVDGRSMVPDVPGRAGDATVEAAMARCVVHGVLHLCGYDHEAGRMQALEMFALEQAVLDDVAGVPTQGGPA